MLFKQLGWARCAMLSSTSNVYLRTASAEWKPRLQNDRIRVEPFNTFNRGEFDGKSLDAIAKASVRIVVVLACSEDTATVAIKAWQRVPCMMDAGWAWVGMDTVPGAEHIVPASAPALSGWLYLIVADNDSQKMSNFYEDVRSYGGKYFDSTPDSVSVYSASLYDAVHLFAHAATRVIRDGGKSNNGTALVEAMRGLTFNGVPDTCLHPCLYICLYTCP